MSLETLVLQASWIMVLVTGPLAILSLIIGKLKGVRFTVPEVKDEESPFSKGEPRKSIQTRTPVKGNLVNFEEDLGELMEETEMTKKKEQPKQEEEPSGTMRDLFPPEEQKTETKQEPEKPKQEKHNGNEEENGKNQGGRPKTPVIEKGEELFEIVPKGTEGAIEVQMDEAKIMFHGMPLRAKSTTIWIKPKTAQKQQTETPKEEEPLFPPETEEGSQR